MNEQRLTSAIQEALLALLCFDSETGQVIFNLVPTNCYDAFYRDFATEAVAFRQRFGHAPGEHTLDILETLQQKRSDAAEIYLRIYESMEAIRGEINGEYILSRATEFIRQQRLRSAIIRAVDLLKEPATEDLDEAERVLQEAMKSNFDIFDPGLELSDVKRMLRFLDPDSREVFMTGVRQLDDRDLGPARKELHLFMGLMGSGKTWWLINLAKWALLTHQKVVHITLEVSEQILAQRYTQSLFSVSKRKEDFVRQAFEEDELGRFVSMESVEMPDRPSFHDTDIRAVLTEKLSKVKGKLVIKEFPTGDLTLRQIEGYLDTLEMSKGFIPDLLLVDYPDLMTVDPNNIRGATSAIFKGLRGLGVKRNIGIAAVTQSNRAGFGTKVITAEHTSEDFSKGMTADVLLTFNQTQQERELGLARLFVAKGRNDRDHFTVLLSQNYGVGQFCLDSVRMMPKYWKTLSTEQAHGDGDDE